MGAKLFISTCSNPLWSNSKVLSFVGIFLLMVLITVPCAAQEGKIDSLKRVLQTLPVLKQAPTLLELTYEYADKDNKLAMAYARQGLRISESIGDSLMIVKCGRLKSLLYRRFDEMDSSLVLSERILPIAERNKYGDDLKKILNGLALVYAYKAQYDKALSSYLRILDASDPEKNKKEYSTALQNVGVVYFKLDDLDQALDYFNRSLLLRDEATEKRDIQTTILNIGLCYVYQRNYAASKEITDKMFSVCKSDCPADQVGEAHYNYGLIAYGQKQLDVAEGHFLKSYESAKEFGNDLYELDNLIALFKIYTDTKNMIAAKKLLNDANAILSRKSYYTQGVMELYGELAKVYQQLGNIDQVALYQDKYIQLRDSVYNEQLTTNLMKVEAQYLERENRAKIEAQAKILELSDGVIIRQRAINIGVCIVALLSIVIVAILMQNVKQKRLANSLLEQKVKERTSQLEANHLNLLKSLEERNQQVKRITSEIKSSMATIKGLCQLSLQDGSVGDRGQYITKIERASDTLQSGIYRTLGINENAA